MRLNCKLSNMLQVVSTDTMCSYMNTSCALCGDSIRSYTSNSTHRTLATVLLHYGRYYYVALLTYRLLIDSVNDPCEST
jgi:hypothetical protein